MYKKICQQQLMLCKNKNEFKPNYSIYLWELLRRIHWNIGFNINYKFLIVYILFIKLLLYTIL